MRDPIEPDACRVVEVDGEPVRVHGGEPMSDKARAAFAEVVRAARRRLDADADAEVGEPKPCEHSWKFWGDDPYEICVKCDEIVSAQTGRVIQAGKPARRNSSTTRRAS